MITFLFVPIIKMFLQKCCKAVCFILPHLWANGKTIRNSYGRHPNICRRIPSIQNGEPLYAIPHFLFRLLDLFFGLFVELCVFLCTLVDDCLSAGVQVVLHTGIEHCIN